MQFLQSHVRIMRFLRIERASTAQLGTVGGPTTSKMQLRTHQCRFNVTSKAIALARSGSAWKSSARAHLPAGENETKIVDMKTISGAILILASEQAFAHSQMVPFPNHVFANEVLYPSSIGLAIVGIVLLIWGTIFDRQQQRPSS